MEYHEFASIYNIKANPQQENAIKSVDNNILLLAVPGSGKTTTLVARAGYMIYCKNIPANKILIITYTVAAAEDMKRRFIEKFGPENVPEFRTINGICAKIIERFCNKEGLKQLELLSDEKESSRIVSSLLQITGEYPLESEIREAKTFITFAKNMMLKKEEIETLDVNIAYPGGAYAFLSDYKKYLKENHLMDYDDQMVYSLYYLRHFPWLLGELKTRYPYIFVDEAQDTSKIQHSIIRLIAGKNGNIFMVGDEDQSIYGFRAAYPEALLNFEETYNNTQTMLLETNYRSDTQIIDTANRFIKKNIYRKPKTIVANSKESGACSFYKVPDDKGQYDAVLKLINDDSTSQTAILYRNNDSAIPLMDMFDKFNVPFTIKGNNSNFFTDRAVTDVINIMLFSKNRGDADLFMKLYYKMGLFMTKKEAEKLCEIAKKDIVKAIADKIFPKDDRRKFIWGNFARNMGMIAKLPPNMAINYLTKEGGMYRKYADASRLNLNPIRILKFLANDCKDTEELLDKLESLKQRMINGAQDNDKLILSTIHASKGLEYDRVIMIDVFDGCLPSSIVENYAKSNSKDIKAYEEERRLFYVGITRAKHSLVVIGIAEKPISFYREISTKPKEKTKLASKLLGES